MKLIIRLLVNAFVIFLVANYLPAVTVDGFVSALVVALLLGVVNAIIKPVLTLLTLPITLITLGLFTLVINGLMVVLVDALVSGFSVDSFLWAIGFSLIISVISSIVNKLTN